MQQPLYARIFAAILVSLGLSLMCPTPAMASNFGEHIVEKFLFSFTAIVLFLIYVVRVTISIRKKAFGSFLSVVISLLLSMVVSVLLLSSLGWLGFQAPTLEQFLLALIGPLTGAVEFIPWLILNTLVFLFCFIWLAPVIQYWVLRRRKN